MRRITIISQYWEPDLNGDVIRLRKIIKLLRKKFDYITLVTTIPHYPYGDRRSMNTKKPIIFEWLGKIRVIRLWMPPIPHKGLLNRLLLYSWFAITSIPVTLIFSRSAIILAFSQKVFSTYSALAAKMLWRAKVVSDVTDVWPEALVNVGYLTEQQLLYKIARLIAKVAYNLSDKITTLTDRMAEIFTKTYWVDRRKIVIIPNTAQIFRASKQQGRPKPILLYFGNLGRNYDFNPIVELGKQIENLGVKIIIRGNGEQLPDIQREISLRKIKNIELVGRQLSQEELMELTSMSLALLLPMGRHKYPDASFPIKLIEYLASGKPIIVIGNGYHAELVTNNRIGIAIKHEDIAEASSYIRSLREAGPEKFNQIRENAHAVLGTFFSENRARDALTEALS